jgi:REP element-mobilizing transposase RayT
MSRPLRLEYPGAVWHVTSRGNERREVFRDDADREGFLSILGRTVSLFRWKLHAFVLMGNHYHLLFETPEPTLSCGMRQLNGLYTQVFNRRHRRSGHLFQGRFKAILVEKDSHLLELARYLVLNPVRAGLARSAKDWPWSSYRATASLTGAPEWLETDWTLEQFAGKRTAAVLRYREFVADGKGAGYRPWKNVRGQIYLGSKRFLSEMERKVSARQTSKEIPKRQRQPGERKPTELFARGMKALEVNHEDLLTHPRWHAAERKVLAHLLRQRGLLPLRQIGNLLGVGEAQASLLVAAGEKLLAAGSGLRHKLERTFLEDDK